MRFSDIIASLIHDMKNSLGMVINTLEEMNEQRFTDTNNANKMVALQHEAKRLNNNLIALLSLYKIDNGRISPNIEEWNLNEFLEEVIAENRISAEARSVTLDYKCDPDLVGYFDEGLIRSVINNIIGNGLRYTQDRMSVTAEMYAGYLVLRVEDNGDGYPQVMLDAQQAEEQHDTNNQGHTQLGIYFASLVANMHKNKDQTGYVQLSNGHSLEGGCFSIWLP